MLEKLLKIDWIAFCIWDIKLVDWYVSNFDESGFFFFFLLGFLFCIKFIHHFKKKKTNENCLIIWIEYAMRSHGFKILICWNNYFIIIFFKEKFIYLISFFQNLWKMKIRNQRKFFNRYKSKRFGIHQMDWNGKSRLFDSSVFCKQSLW